MSLNRTPRRDIREIEKAACDGRVIAGIRDIIFFGKSSASALALIPASTDILTACEAMREAEKRVKYALGIDLTLRPCPFELAENSAERYREAVRVIISAIDRDFRINNFTCSENEKGIFFSFELSVPRAYEKNNAELLIELNRQLRKLSNKIVSDITIIRI